MPPVCIHCVWIRLSVLRPCEKLGGDCSGEGSCWSVIQRQKSHGTLEMLIGLGIGGGGMTTVVSILFSDIIPLRERGTWQGYMNIVYATGFALGGPLGGVLSDTIGWRCEESLSYSRQSHDFLPRKCFSPLEIILIKQLLTPSLPRVCKSSTSLACFALTDFRAFIGQFPLTLIASTIVYLVLDLPKSEDSNWLEKLRRIDFLGAFSLVIAVFCRTSILILICRFFLWELRA